ncbi:SETD8 [Lepeophtheirus salmonis]|uniref:SETD8 n=1 Tax=Lepeophtheirus salmonis TaxID=72036 RepID=A0A7R8H255_LEPSM|nr:SETD8 [Lepeophtheirus salmonis]CAF2821917.1 SETD8 [Lepeophtheirus salmonis]
MSGARRKNRKCGTPDTILTVPETEEEPKYKDSRLENGVSRTRRSSRSRITDYFPPSSIPSDIIDDIIPDPDDDEIPSEGGNSSGKENDLDSNSEINGLNNSAFVPVNSTRSKILLNKMPLTTFADNVSPPPSPSKLGTSPSASSPPTPHKIKLIIDANTDNKKPQNLKKTKNTVISTKKRTSHTSSLKKTATAKNNSSSIKNGSHKVTEYFPIRRSSRKSKKELDKLYIAEIEDILRRGIQAMRNFSKGEFVVEYAGDLVEVDVAKERENQYSKDHSTGCYMYYFKHNEKQYCMDATKDTGRLGRLVNHSRLHPNLLTKVVILENKPRLILVARQDIEKYSELLYDYGDSIHIGQAGCQIGEKCWQLFSLEHGIDEEGNVPPRSDNSPEGSRDLSTFYEISQTGKHVPRCLFLDLEPTVVDGIRSDAANNFARGTLHKHIKDEYKRKCSLNFTVYPSPRVSTAVVEPYNTILGTHFTMDSMNCSFLRPTYVDLNRLIAQVTSSVTASLRFEGSLNMDLNEFQTNLVPFPRLHFPLVSYAPITNSSQFGNEVLNVDELTNSCFSSSSQMRRCSSQRS